MKNILVLFLLIPCLALNAQTKKEQEVIQKVRALNKAIFFDKDSVALGRLLASTVTYGHSGGKVENRHEMIRGAVHNPSTYSEQATTGIEVLFHQGTAVARHVFSAVEIKEGKRFPLKLGVMQVWIEEKGEWKLMARQSVRLE